MTVLLQQRSFGAPLYVTVLDHLRILSFSLFQDTDTDNRYKSKHLKGRSVPRVSHVFLITKDFAVFPFLDTFRIQRILLFSLFLDTFRIQRILLFSLFLDTFPFQKCLETGKRTKSRERNHYFQGIWSFFLFPITLTFQKCLETGKTTKSLEKMIIVKGFCHFSCL